MFLRGGLYRSIENSRPSMLDMESASRVDLAKLKKNTFSQLQSKPPIAFWRNDDPLKK